MIEVTKDKSSKTTEIYTHVSNFKVSLGFFLMNNHISKNISPSYCLYISLC
ncbi:hypothetical protein C5S53_05750 [Methanophagales archaeon]|nr:hypothetical protein C5S53_05750 [Methanophagales archaeon]